MASLNIQSHNQAVAGHQSQVNQGRPYLTDDAGADFSPKRSVAIVSAILFGAGIP
jgi:hypothetical protein